MSKHAMHSGLSPRAFTLLAWGLFASAALVEALGAAVRAPSAQARVLLLQDFALLGLWALAVPAIVWSSRRLPIRGASGWRHAVLHLTVALVFVTATNVAVRLPLVGSPGHVGTAWLITDTLQGLARFGPVALVVYAALVAAAQATAPRHPIAEPDTRASTAMEPLETSDSGSLPPDATAGADGWRAPSPSYMADGLPDRIVVRSWNRVHLVRPADIEWVEADDNNVVVHTRGRTHKGRGRIGDFESRLDPAVFVRIHRSAIVHVSAVREVQPLPKGNCAVVLHDGKVLRVARSRRAALEASLGVTI